MSWADYEKAMKLLEQHKDKCELNGEQSETVIEQAEVALGIKFPKIYRHFVKNYGAGKIGDEEIYGIENEQLINSKDTDTIMFTLTARKEADLSNNYLIIFNRGEDNVVCLDFNKLTQENEPAVVALFLHRDYNHYLESIDLLADDLGEYILDIVQDELVHIERKLELTIDLNGVTNVRELHLLLKESLNFPRFYGANWDAFWDAITGLVELPKKIIFVGWSELERRLPEDSKLMKECLLDLNQEYPECKSEYLFN